MLITGTGFFGTDRAELKALTKQLGAHYSGELVRGATTVLVVPDSWLSEGEISDKCRKAIQWGLPPIVRRQWLLDSACAGSALPYNAYMVTAAHAAASVEPNPSSSGQHCVRVSCSTNLTLVDTEPELSTARIRSCGRAGRDSASASARHALLAPVAPHTHDSAAGDEVVSGDGINIKQGFCSAKAQSPKEPERRRAADHAAAADSFGLDDLEPLHSPGALLIQHFGGFSRLIQLNLNLVVLVCKPPVWETRSEAHVSQPWPAGTTPATRPASDPHPGIGATEIAASCPPPDSARSIASGRREAVGGESVVLCGVGRPIRPPPGNSVKLFHNLRNLGGVRFYDTLQVTTEAQDFNCGSSGSSQGVLLHTGDTADGEHVLSYAEVFAIYALRSGEVWVEHSYLYDEEDIQNDSRGRGAEYLASHPLQPHELVRGSGAYHSRASAIKGSCRIFASPEARDAAAAVEGESEDCPLLFCASGWDPGTGQPLAGVQSARASRKRSSASAHSVSKLRRNV